MPFSHHSHSGQFCPGHARNTLEEMIQMAMSKKMKVFALTEHMPRHDVDLYPEEGESGWNLERHLANEAAYFKEAIRLREKYRSQIQLPVGFEADWIRPESLDLILQSLERYQFDFFIGSVHHVHTIPIDFDRQFYLDARRAAGGTDEKLFEDYFDAQLAMLQALRPPVVGHFDLIRLMSDNPNNSLKALPTVWQRILRNLDYIALYGGIVEINTASLRKGMSEPYPGKDICQAGIERGLRFCLSDDSHGIDQVALNYSSGLSYLQETGIKTLSYVTHDRSQLTPFDQRFPYTQISQINCEELEKLVCPAA